MKIIRKSNQLSKALDLKRQRKKRIGFVPTMGALHEGHLKLVEAAKKKADIIVVSIFVNPTQFGPQEDFKKYPRVLNKDKKLLEKLKVDYLFYPSVSEIYPKGAKKQSLEKRDKSLEKVLCGRYRPGHFKGVVQVVSRLFDIVGPCDSFFGAKDYQQSAVIESMIQTFKIPVKLIRVPTVREKSGLALSSRNAYLSSADRERALALSLALKSAKESILKTKKSIVEIKKEMTMALKEVVDKVQYFEIVDAKNLKALKKRRYPICIATACYLGQTRLIDNVIIRGLRK